MLIQRHGWLTTQTSKTRLDTNRFRIIITTLHLLSTMSPREQPHPSGDSADFGDRVPSQSSLASLERSSKGVAFGSVSVRVYERIVGDHPGTRRRTSIARFSIPVHQDETESFA